MVRRGLAAGAAFVCTTAALAVGTVDPVGTWNTGRGPLTIEKAADGTFFARLRGVSRTRRPAKYTTLARAAATCA